MDELDLMKKMEIMKYEEDKETQKLFQKQFREFTETERLYRKFEIKLPPARVQFKLNQARFICEQCKEEQIFRPVQFPSWHHFNDRYLRPTEKQVLRKYESLINGIFPIELECFECQSR